MDVRLSSQHITPLQNPLLPNEPSQAVRPLIRVHELLLQEEKGSEKVIESERGDERRIVRPIIARTVQPNLAFRIIRIRLPVLVEEVRA